MEHMQYLVVRSHNAEGKPFNHPMERADDMEHEHMCGHALMATCPPYSHVMEKPAENYPHQMPQGLPKSDLIKLFEASHSVRNFDGPELTPVQAWMRILHHPTIASMSVKDVELIQTTLLQKVRCYGYVNALLPRLPETCADYLLASAPSSRSSRSGMLSILSSPSATLLLLSTASTAWPSMAMATITLS